MRGDSLASPPWRLCQRDKGNADPRAQSPFPGQPRAYLLVTTTSADADADAALWYTPRTIGHTHRPDHGARLADAIPACFVVNWSLLVVHTSLHSSPRISHTWPPAGLGMHRCAYHRLPEPGRWLVCQAGRRASSVCHYRAVPSQSDQTCPFSTTDTKTLRSDPASKPPMVQCASRSAICRWHGRAPRRVAVALLHARNRDCFLSSGVRSTGRPRISVVGSRRWKSRYTAHRVWLGGNLLPARLLHRGCPAFVAGRVTLPR